MDTSFFLSPAGAISQGAVPPEDALCFSNPQELARITNGWPLRRLAEIWNGLIGVQPVQRFENHSVAVARIWRALQPNAPPRQVKRRQRPASPRENTKGARILALLSRPQGATVPEIMTATGWQAHSIRGFISGNLVAKRRLKVRTFTRAGAHVYRVPALGRSRTED